MRAAVGEHESPEFHKQSQEFVEVGVDASVRYAD